MFEFIRSIFRNETPIYCKIENIWYDLGDFAKLHPGGRVFLQKYHMKDVTEQFYKISAHEEVNLEMIKKVKS